MRLLAPQARLAMSGVTVRTPGGNQLLAQVPALWGRELYVYVKSLVSGGSITTAQVPALWGYALYVCV